MKIILLIQTLLLLWTNGLMSQEHKEFLRDFSFGDKLSPEKKISTFNKFNFSELWTSTQNHHIVGIIGSNHQRIKIKLLEVGKSSHNPNIYKVTGKSSVKGNVCEFKGTITIKQIHTSLELHYGVDSIYADSSIQTQGIIIADYRFEEDVQQKYSGVFEGTLYTKWYLDSSSTVRYDDIRSISDSYMNNAHIGTWTSHNTGYSKTCNWGDYRVPLANKDFDIGAGEFSPSEKYLDNGWKTYQEAWIYGKENARKRELSHWWK